MSKYIVGGMIKAPESAEEREPVIVMALYLVSTPNPAIPSWTTVVPPVASYKKKNCAYREVEEKRRRERRQAVDFPGKGKRIAKISFIFFKDCSMARVVSTVFL